MFLAVKEKVPQVYNKGFKELRSSITISDI